MDRLDYAASGVASVINVAARELEDLWTRRGGVMTDDRHHLRSSTKGSAVRVGNR